MKPYPSVFRVSISKLRPILSRLFRAKQNRWWWWWGFQPYSANLSTMAKRAYGWFSRYLPDPWASHACISLDKCWFAMDSLCTWIWDLRPSIWNLASWNCENWLWRPLVLQICSKTCARAWACMAFGRLLPDVSVKVRRLRRPSDVANLLCEAALVMGVAAVLLSKGKSHVKGNPFERGIPYKGKSLVKGNPLQREIP